MNIDIADNLSSLTNVPKATLSSILEKESLCIAHGISELDAEDILIADIGIGSLSIGKTEDGIKYRFIPSKTLEENVNLSFNGIDPLSKKLEESLSSRIVSTYKNLF